MPKDFSQAETLVQNYCFEEDVTKARTRKIMSALSDREKLGKLCKSDGFIVWDALGLCHDRDETTDKIYQFMGLYL